MNWIEYLKQIRLAEIKDLKVDQAGVVNVKVEHHHYHLHYPDPSVFQKVQEADFTPELEEKIKEEVAKLLTPLGVTLNALPEPSMKEVVISTSLATATQVIPSPTISQHVKLSTSK